MGKHRALWELKGSWPSLGVRDGFLEEETSELRPEGIGAQSGRGSEGIPEQQHVQRPRGEKGYSH